MQTNLTFNQTLSGNRRLILKRLLVLRAALLCAVVVALLSFTFLVDVRIHTAAYLLPLVGFGFCGYWVARYRKGASVTDANLLRQLVFDAVFLLVLIYFTGGATNPFIYYLLVLVAISAAIFNSIIGWLFSAGCMLAYTFIMFTDVREHVHHMSSDFQLHLLGMWVNFVGSAVLICFFVSRLATALRDRQIELSKVREETLKNEQLVGIGTLAASTVHALGTPLSTMAVVLGEMQHSYKQGAAKWDASSQNENVELMLGQIERCKKTLSKLSLLSQQQQDGGSLENIAEFSDELKEHYLLANPRIMPAIVFNNEQYFSEFFIEQSVLFRHAVINLVDNAIQAAVRQVKVCLEVDAKSKMLTIDIEDDGNGLPSDIEEQWGKPVISQKESGMGIGIFLSNSTVEKLGGKVQVKRKPQATQVSIKLPVTGAKPAGEEQV